MCYTCSKIILPRSSQTILSTTHWLISSIFSTVSTGEFLNVRPKKSFICPIKIVTAIPEVKPVVIVNSKSIVEVDWNAKNISIKEAINKKVVSIKDWKKYARKIRKDGDAEILQFENYEIACVYDDCIIRPLSK